MEETEEEKPKTLEEYIKSQAQAFGFDIKDAEQFTLPNGDVEYRSGANGDPKGGVLHRGDGPAVIKANGDQQWWTFNVLDRKDGPAIERADGYKAYFDMGRLHRTDGPAITTQKGSTAWFKKLSQKEGGRPSGPHRDNNEPAIELSDGRKYYFKEGKAHRDDGPVIKDENIEVWKREGELHRMDGPAFQAPNHTEYRTFNVLHRTDGPAYEKDGVKKHYLHGVEFYPTDFREVTKNSPKEIVAAIMKKHPSILLHAAKLFFTQGDKAQANMFKMIHDMMTRSQRDAGRF